MHRRWNSTRACTSGCGQHRSLMTASSPAMPAAPCCTCAPLPLLSPSQTRYCWQAEHERIALAVLYMSWLNFARTGWPAGGAPAPQRRSTPGVKGWCALILPARGAPHRACRQWQCRHRPGRPADGRRVCSWHQGRAICELALRPGSAARRCT